MATRDVPMLARALRGCGGPLVLGKCSSHLSCMAREISRVSALALDERRLEDTVAHAVRSVSIVKPRASVDSSVHFARFDSVMTTSRPSVRFPDIASLNWQLLSENNTKSSINFPNLQSQTLFCCAPPQQTQGTKHRERETKTHTHTGTHTGTHRKRTKPSKKRLTQQRRKKRNPRAKKKKKKLVRVQPLICLLHGG